MISWTPPAPSLSSIVEEELRTGKESFNNGTSVGTRIDHDTCQYQNIWPALKWQNDSSLISYFKNFRIGRVMASYQSYGNIHFGYKILENSSLITALI